MEKLPEEIWLIDATLRDLLVYDARADRAPAEIQVGQGLGRTRLICSIDPDTRRVTDCRLSYGEEEM